MAASSSSSSSAPPSSPLPTAPSSLLLPCSWGLIGALPATGWLAHFLFTRWLFVVDVALLPEWRLVLGAWTLWLALEIVFYLVLRLQLYQRLEKLQPPAPNPRGGIETIRLVLNVARQVSPYYPFKDFIAKWFKGTPMEELHEENVRDLLAWAGYNKTPDQLTTQEAAELQQLMDAELPSLWSEYPLPPGRNPRANSPIRMTLEPMQFYHRPLFGVLLMKLLQVTGAVMLTMWGFTRYESGRVMYWYRDGPRDRLPLLFFHGISPGLCTYLLFVAVCTPGRPCVLFETPHIAMSMQCFAPPSKVELLQAVKALCKRHGMDKVCVGGQSFGSIHAGWVMEGLPELVAQAVYLDPVNFLLCCPDVAYNFLYRVPSPSVLMENLIYYVAAREVTVASTLRRHFWWYENMSHLEAAHCPVVIGLAEKDEVAPAEVLRQYIQRHQQQQKSRQHKQHVVAAAGGGGGQQPDVELIYWRGYSHAQCLMVPWALRDLDDAMRRQENQHYYCLSPPALAAAAAGGHHQRHDESSSGSSGSSSKGLLLMDGAGSFNPSAAGELLVGDALVDSSLPLPPIPWASTTAAVLLLLAPGRFIFQRLLLGPDAEAAGASS